jgi:DNA-binding YbaB/EbfC family protein
MNQPPDWNEMLSRAQQMQQQIAAVQRALASRSVEASSGGGMVTARVSGELRVLAIEIEPSLFANGDRALLQDLVAAAVNAALLAAHRMMQDELQRVAGSGSGPITPLTPG